MVYKRFFILSLLVSFGVFSTFSMHKNNRRKSKEPTEFMDNFASKKECSFDQEKGDSFEDTASLPRTHEYVQLKVFNQSSILGGGASCGYHALKNGLLIARLLLEGDSSKAELEQKLLSKELVGQLFSQRASPWRTYIIESRARQLAASYIRDALLKSMLGVRIGNDGPYALNLESRKVSFDPFKENVQENEIEREALQGILSTVSQQLASIKGVRENNLLLYELTPELIIGVCKEFFIKNTKNDKNKDAYQALQDSARLKRYIPHLANFSFFVQDDNVILSPKQEVLYTYTYAGGLGKLRPEWNKSSALGQWLETEEIKALYAFEKERNGELIQGLEDNPDLPFYGMFYIEDALHNPIKNQFETNEQLLYLIDEMHSPYSSFVAGLIIHQAEAEHWFTCVIKKDRNKNLYVFADSANNIPRINDIHARNVIRILNGQEPFEQPKKSSQEQAKPKEAEPPSANTAKPQPSASKTESKPEEYTSASFYNASEEKQGMPSGFSEGVPTLKLEDIIGVPLEVTRIVQALSNPTPRNSVYALILHGPPGTGKTELAHAIAGATGREIFSVYASSVVDKYIGSGPKTIKTLFTQARQSGKPAIVFIDEIDLITGRNDADRSDSHSYQETRVALHAELDKKDPNIFFVAATNHLDKIDSTIRDRLADFTIKMDLPKRDQRKQILALHARKSKIEIPGQILDRLADATEGLSGRVLEKMIRKAVTLADLRDPNNFQVTEYDLYSALYSSDERVPQQAQREAMLRHFAASKTGIGDEDYRKLATLTAGLSGATIEKLVNQAYELSQSEDAQGQISLAHFSIALYSFNPKNTPDNGIRRILLSNSLAKRNINISVELLEKLVQRSEGLDQPQLEKVLLKALRYADTKHQLLTERDFIVALFAKYTKKIPNQNERQEILNFYLQNRMLRLPNTYALDFIARCTHQWTKAQIKKLARKAYTLAQETERDAIEETDLYVAQILTYRETNAAAQIPGITLTKEGIVAMLEYYTRCKQHGISPGFFNSFIISDPKGFTFDHIMQLISQAELIAQRRASPIEDDDFRAAYLLLTNESLPLPAARAVLFRALIGGKTSITKREVLELIEKMPDLTARQFEEMIRRAEEIARESNQGQLNITKDHFYTALYSIHRKKRPERDQRLAVLKYYFLKRNLRLDRYRDEVLRKMAILTQGFDSILLKDVVDKSFKVMQKRHPEQSEPDYFDIIIAIYCKQKYVLVINGNVNPESEKIKPARIDEEDFFLLFDYYLIGRENDIIHYGSLSFSTVEWKVLKTLLSPPYHMKATIKQAQIMGRETRALRFTLHDILAASVVLAEKFGPVSLLECLTQSPLFIEAMLTVYSRGKGIITTVDFLKKLATEIYGRRVVLAENWMSSQEAFHLTKYQPSTYRVIDINFENNTKLVQKFKYELNRKDIIRIVEKAKESADFSKKSVFIDEFYYEALRKDGRLVFNDPKDGGCCVS